MKSSFALRATLLALTFAAARSGAAQSGSASPSLASQARISKDSAQRLALGRVPGGKVESGELEREHGKLVYSFDIKVAGRSGIEEVQIDAVSGALVSSVHETPEMEAAEAAADRRAAAAKQKPKPTAPRP